MLSFFFFFFKLFLFSKLFPADVRVPWSVGRPLKSVESPTAVLWLGCFLLNKVRGIMLVQTSTLSIMHILPFKCVSSVLFSVSWEMMTAVSFNRGSWRACSEGTAAVWRKRLQFAGDSSVHLRPQISRHSPAGNHPREKHGDSAPAPNQQVLKFRLHSHSYYVLHRSRVSNCIINKCSCSKWKKSVSMSWWT